MMKRLILFSARFYQAKAQTFRLYSFDRETHKVTPITTTNHSDTRPELSPDGRKILFLRQIQSQRQLFVHDQETKREWALLMREPSAFGWMPDSKQAWVAASEGALEYRVSLYDTLTKKKERSLPGDFEPIWSPNKERYCFSEKEGEWQVISVRDGESIKILLIASTLIWQGNTTLWGLGVPGKTAPTGDVPQFLEQVSVQTKMSTRLPLHYQDNTELELRTRLTASWLRLLWLPHTSDILLLYGRMTPSRYLGVKLDTRSGEVTPWGEFGGQMIPLESPFFATLGDTTDMPDAQGNFQRVRGLYRASVSQRSKQTPIITGLVQIHSLSS